MRPEVLEAFALATAGLASPGAILITLMLLATQKGGRKAAALWAGYATGLTLVGMVTLSLGARTDVPAESSQQVRPAFIVLGSLLLLFALRTWRSKRQEEGPVHVLQKLDDVRASRMAAFGLLGSVVNVKNLALYVAALTPLMQLEGDVMDKAPLVVACVLIFTSAIATPIALFAVGRARVQPLLVRARQALERNKRRVALTVLVVFGSFFLWRGLSPLLG